MYRISKAASGRYTANRATRWAPPFTKRQLFQAARRLWPMLATLSFAGAAHAQGTMDFSGAQTLMGTFKFLLGHASIQTTERYLGSDQEIAVAVNDNLGL
jgi:hypothetical protein